MKTIDKNKVVAEHNFYKHNSEVLKQLFGTDDVSSFWLADMDFQIAEPISKEIKRLADWGVFAYEFNAERVFEAIVNWYKSRHQLSLDKNSFLQVSGVLTGISLLIQELTEVGDGVLIQTPVYHQFASIIKKTNRRVVQNPLMFHNGRYEMDFADLENKLQTENVKMIVLCNPHNPVGRVWEKQELQQLADLANKYEVLIVSDEIHADIVYTGSKFNSIASLGEPKHIALLGSPAKTFGMHSFSHGYLHIRDESTRKQIREKVEILYLHHGNAISDYATIAAYQHGVDWLDELTTYLEENIRWMDDFIKRELPMLKMVKPEGTYQVWLDFREMKLSKDELNHLLTDNAKLALAPGSWFGKNGIGYMRMNIASPLNNIKDAFARLKAAIDHKSGE